MKIRKRSSGVSSRPLATSLHSIEAQEIKLFHSNWDARYQPIHGMGGGSQGLVALSDQVAKAPARWVLGHDSCAHFVGDQKEGELGPLHIIHQGVDSGGDLLIRELGCHQIGDPEGHAVN